MQTSANNTQLSICFYGSSDEGLDSPLAVLHANDVKNIVSQVLDLEFESFQIITGGYGGIMDLVATEFKTQSASKNKTVQIVGITCDAYEFENPEDKTKTYEKSNDYTKANDIVIQAESFPARIQAMIELSDVFVVLPGKQGSLSELLITSEAYAYPIETLKNKNHKILVHNYWEKLVLSSVFFRRFKNIYFFTNDFKDKIIDFYPSAKNDLTLSESYPNHTIKDAFEKLRKEIENIVYGKIAKQSVEQQKKFKTRLKYKENLLAIDFGWFLSSGATYNGEYFTQSSNKYIEILNAFFGEKNSIMFNTENKELEFRVKYLKGKLSEDAIVEKGIIPIPIPKEDKKKSSTNFNEWATHLENNKYGQTLIWQSIKSQSGEQTESVYKLNLSIFLLFNCYLPTRKIEKIRQRIDSFFASVSSEKTAELFQKKDKDLQQAATRAAISQVMARNMSHNIGSHVMNILVNEKYLGKFNPESLLSYKTKLQIEDYSTTFSQLAIYNNYVKSRMDYLADITFGTPVMLSNKKTYNDVFCELDKVRLLLENISGRGEKFRYNISFKYNEIELNDKNDISLAIPNDVLGCQAFYNIIENVIRNTAKHGSLSTDEECTFTINIRDIKPEEVDSKLKFEANTLYCVEIHDNIKVSNANIIEEQNDKINKRILDDSNQLRSESLGMIEMDASAAYLRQLDIVSINSDDYDVEDNKKLHNSFHFNILKAFNASPEPDISTILGYRFFVKKPQEALIVTDLEIDDEDHLTKKGITVISCVNFKKQLESDNAFNHEFLIIEKGKEVEGFIEDKTGSLPLRKHVKEKACIETLLNEEDIVRQLWKWREEELLGDYKNSNKTLTINGRPRFSTEEDRWSSDFDNHLYTMIEECEREGKKMLDEWKKTTANSFHYEVCSSKGQSLLPTIYGKNQEIIPFDKYLSNLNKECNYIAKIKVAESMLSRIIVIDERIQEKLEDKLYEISFSEHYRMSNIYVPEKKDNNTTLDLKDEKIVIGDLEKYIEKTTQKENNNIPFDFNSKYDFLLVHYSILERAYGSLSEDKKKECPDRKTWINNWFDKYQDKFTIVVTSGRGNVKDLSKYVRFVNLSSLTTALKEIKSKYLIHQILYSSRKTK